MTLEEIKEMKREAEAALLGVVVRFEESTGLTIDRLAITRSYRVGVQSLVVEVKAEVSL